MAQHPKDNPVTNRSRYREVLRGRDAFRPHDLETETIDAENLPCWLLNTDYSSLMFTRSRCDS